MTGSQNTGSLLYRRLSTLRRVLPGAAALAVLAYETAKILWVGPPWQSSPVQLRAFIVELVIYGVVGPTVAWLALTWTVRRVGERDEAEAHLRSLYEMSRKAVTTTEVAALVEIALSMPGEVLRPVATSLILREGPEGHWVLAGSRGFRTDQREALEAYLASTGAHARCDPSHILAATQHMDCPMLAALPADIQSAAASVICLPLSTGRPPHAVLSVYLPAEVDLSSEACQTLESMAAGLSVALDHARVRARELEMLGRMERAVRQRGDLAAALDDILADVCSAHQAEQGVVFLVSPGEQRILDPASSWPGEGAPADLARLAEQALRELQPITQADPEQRRYSVAAPLAVEGRTVGVLALTGQRSFGASQQAMIAAATRFMAVVVRSSQLHRRLESEAVLEERVRLAREVHDGLAQGLGFLNLKLQQVDRLLERREWQAARRALRELRAGVQDLYAEVRLTLWDLRWRPERSQGLAERLQQVVAGFADRSGLDVSLTIDGEPGLPSRDELQLLRIVQEALANVRRHARAQHISVRLRAAHAATVLEVEDDGVGLHLKDAQVGASLDPLGQFGLRHIRERAEGMGGRLDLHSVADQGTVLKVTVPVPDVSTQSEGG